MRVCCDISQTFFDEEAVPDQVAGLLAGWGGAAGGTAVPIEILQVSNDGITMRVRGALQPLAPCVHRAGRMGHELRVCLLVA